MNFIENINTNLFSTHSIDHNEGYIFMDMHSWARALLFAEYREKLKQDELRIFIDGSYVKLFLSKDRKSHHFKGPDMLLHLIRKKDELLILGPEKNHIQIFKKKTNLFSNVKIKYLTLPFVEDPQQFDISYIIQTIENEEIKDVIIILGCPKQEILLSILLKKINKKGLKFYALGAAFNFFIETEKRAPSIIQNFKLEWLYRLIKNPKKQGARIMLIIRAVIKYVFSFSSKISLF